MSEQELTVMTDDSQVPAFKSEKEEAEFWDTHTFAPGMMTKANAAELEAAGLLPSTPPRPVRPAKSNPLSLDVDL